MALPALSLKIDMQKIPLSGFEGAVIGRFRAAPPSFLAPLAVQKFWRARRAGPLLR